MRKIYRNTFKTSKVFYDDEQKRIAVTIRIDDQCGNGVCEFAITANIYRQASNNRWAWEAGGCQHKEILKHFPELSDFVALHLSNVHGQPTYAAENGCYLLVKEGVKKCAEYLRIDERTAATLSRDKKCFKYQLFELGIIDQWQREADAAIKHFEELKGEKWVNPYKEEEERFTLRLTDVERREIEQLIESGYFAHEAVRERDEAQKRHEREKARKEIEERFDRKITKAALDKSVYLYVFDTLGTTDNIIYYTHSNKLSFNWQSYGKQWTQSEFVDFCNSADRSQLPDNIEFEIK